MGIGTSTSGAWVVSSVLVAESSRKSQMAMEKMVEGRLRKYFEEVVHLEQKC
jgi:translation elongation factor EF-Ts